jgi:phenylpyruvate tautomerase PptA (4-oxalocrotonate tautomerase family)
MPVIEAHVLRGYAPEEKSRLTSALTDAVRFVVPAPDEAITVMLHEIEPDGYARGGVSRAPAPALPDPAGIVRGYLSAMEARDLDSARALLGDGFEMVFPGTPTMTSLEQLIDWAQGRYRFVKKTYDGIEAFHSCGVAVVYARGTLFGEWPDGTAFEGIRFIDRFEVSGGRIARQDVWNDIAEVRPR